MEEVLPEIRDESYLVFTSRVSVAIYIEDNKKKKRRKSFEAVECRRRIFPFSNSASLWYFCVWGRRYFYGFLSASTAPVFKNTAARWNENEERWRRFVFRFFSFSFSFFVLFFWTIRFCFLFFFLSREWHVFCYDGVPRPSCLSQRHTNKRATITLSLVIDSSFSQRQATERNSVKRKQLG